VEDREVELNGRWFSNPGGGVTVRCGGVTAVGVKNLSDEGVDAVEACIGMGALG